MTNDAQGAPAGAGTHTGQGPLPQEALLELKGADACKFLQGQTTANFEGREALDVVPGAFCNVKGRVILDFLALVVTQDRIILRVSADRVDFITSHLAKYLMFSKAELQPRAHPPQGLMGSAAHAACDLSTPTMPERAQEGATGWVIGLDTEISLLIPDSDADGSGADAADDNEAFLRAWQSAECSRGEARIRASTSEKYLPQDLNYDLAGWVSFDKGCYTGQEIIARLHWRGKPKRRLYAATTEGELPTEGTGLYTEDGGRCVGSVVNAAAGAQGISLLVETTSDAAGGNLTLDHSDQPIAVAASPIQYTEMPGQG